MPPVWNELLEGGCLFVVEMHQNVGRPHGVEFDREHVFVARHRWQGPARMIAQDILSGLEIVRVENDRTIVPLAQADRHGHAEEMVAVDEIDPWRETRALPGPL